MTAQFAEEQIAEIFVKANQDYESISDAESVRLIVLTTSFFRAWEVAFIENRDGHLEENVWDALSRDYRQPMGAPSFRYIWALRKQNYDPGFQEHLAGLEQREYIAR